MKLMLYSLFLMVYASPCFSEDTTPRVHVYDFGENIGSVLSVNSGSMGLFDKTRKVSIKIPGCSFLMFVRVKVDNPVDAPTVKIDWDNYIVTIEYTLLQFSVSEYTVIAKGVRNPFCNRNGASADAQPIQAVESVADSI